MTSTRLDRTSIAPRRLSEMLVTGSRVLSSSLAESTPDTYLRSNSSGRNRQQSRTTGRAVQRSIGVREPSTMRGYEEEPFGLNICQVRRSDTRTPGAPPITCELDNWKTAESLGGGDKLNAKSCLVLRRGRSCPRHRCATHSPDQTRRLCARSKRRPPENEFRK